MKFIQNTVENSGIENVGDIQWVLTVPAIWKPGARHFMRKAAYEVRMQRFSRYIQLEGLVDMNLAEVGRGSYVVRAIGQVLNVKANVFVNNCLFDHCRKLPVTVAVLYRKWVLRLQKSAKFRDLHSYC